MDEGRAIRTASRLVSCSSRSLITGPRTRAYRLRAALAWSAVSKRLLDATTSVAPASVRMTTVPSVPRRWIAACSMPPATVYQSGVPDTQSRTLLANAVDEAAGTRAGLAAGSGPFGAIGFGATLFAGAGLGGEGFFAVHTPLSISARPSSRASSPPSRAFSLLRHGLPGFFPGRLRRDLLRRSPRRRPSLASWTPRRDAARFGAPSSSCSSSQP